MPNVRFVVLTPPPHNLTRHSKFCIRGRMCSHPQPAHAYTCKVNVVNQHCKQCCIQIYSHNILWICFLYKFCKNTLPITKITLQNGVPLSEFPASFHILQFCNVKCQPQTILTLHNTSSSRVCPSAMTMILVDSYYPKFDKVRKYGVFCHSVLSCKSQYDRGFSII
jgi:hypothetical protein